MEPSSRRLASDLRLAAHPPPRSTREKNKERGMSNLKLNCPYCKQSIEVPEKLLGQTVECPACQGSIKLPESYSEVTAPPPIPGPQKQETKDCPYCGEAILAKAKKCKHCGEILDAELKKQRQKESAISRPVPQPPRAQPAQEKVIVQPRGEGCFLQTMNVGCAIIFFIIALIIIFIVVAAVSSR